VISAPVIALLLLSCAHRPPVARPTEPVAVVEQFALARGDRAIAGLAAVRIDGDAVTLDALSPAGIALFRVEASAEGATVTAPDPAWADVLERIPFRRDLLLIHAWDCPEGRCAVAGGTVRQRVEDGALLRRYRGPGGPARARIEEGRATLHDPLRGYDVTLVGGDIHGP